MPPINEPALLRIHGRQLELVAEAIENPNAPYCPPEWGEWIGFIRSSFQKNISGTATVLLCAMIRYSAEELLKGLPPSRLTAQDWRKRIETGYGPGQARGNTKTLSKILERTRKGLNDFKAREGQGYITIPKNKSQLEIHFPTLPVDLAIELDLQGKLTDNQVVNLFRALKPGPSVPIDESIRYRPLVDFEYFYKLAGGDSFFQPFRDVLTQVDPNAPFDIAPKEESVKEWNHKEFAKQLGKKAAERVTNGCKSLEESLVGACRNLSREHLPQTDDEWSNVAIIAVPGARGFDRPMAAAELVRHCPQALIVTSGSGPYYDNTNKATDLTEARAFAAYLRLCGIDGSRIHEERHSRDTDENAQNLLRYLLDLQSPKALFLTTTGYHQGRYKLAAQVAFRRTPYENIILYVHGPEHGPYAPENLLKHDVARPLELKIGVILAEYCKIAFMICAEPRPLREKLLAKRAT